MHVALDLVFEVSVVDRMGEGHFAVSKSSRCTGRDSNLDLFKLDFTRYPFPEQGSLEASLREEIVDKLPRQARAPCVQQIMDQMVAAEQRHIAQRQAQESECECRDGMFPSRAPTSRRTFLVAARSTTGAAAAAALSGAALAQAAPPGAQHFDAPADPTKEQGRAVAADGGYGSRSQFEAEVRVRFPTANEYTSWSFTPLDKMLGNLTASGLHFERHHGGIPTIDPAKHLLVVHGMVNTPKKFTITDLKRFPSVTRKHFIECSGNGLTEWNKPTLKTVQGTHGL
ncbi:MAG TPA: molybdopterin-dependent oxidoreductase, partial [Polyangiaceae bacterium]|nr:molybdopterin-dependent oxidoreductase [Polyangiaceae bacterium]